MVRGVPFCGLRFGSFWLELRLLWLEVRFSVVRGMAFSGLLVVRGAAFCS
jgi:hypothetical protein